jgi:uncharacterized membrane protein
VALIVNRLMLVLAWVGVFVAGVLTAAHWMGLSVPCGRGGGCDQLASHPSSEWFGLPVALYGLGAYLTLVAIASVMLWRPGLAGRLGWVALGISGVGTATSGWLTYQALGVLKLFCPWCLASAGVMTSLFLLSAAFTQADKAPWTAGRLDEMLFGACMILALGGVGTSMATLAQRQNLANEPRTAKVNAPSDLVTNDKYYLGPAEAKVTVVEFADIFCRACRETYLETKRLIQSYPGQIRFAFRHLPFYTMEGHEFSLPAAMLTEIAAEKGKFHEMVDALMTTPDQRIRSIDGLLAVAAGLGLDKESARVRLTKPDEGLLGIIESDIRRASAAGINETPTFVLFAPGEPPLAYSLGGLRAALARILSPDEKSP